MSSEKYKITKPETEMPIWNQIVEMANIQLDILKSLITRKSGIILETKTDSVSCIFPNNLNPFELDEEVIDLNGFY